MRFLRNVYEDLLERRLLPVAALLLLALVAVPLVLAKSIPAAPEAGGGAVPKLHIPSAQPAVSLSSPDREGRLDHLHALNPFQQRHGAKPKRLATVAASAPAAPTPASDPVGGPVASVASAAGSAAAAPSGGGQAGAAPAPSPAPAPARHHVAPTPPRHHYEVASLEVRFGRVDHLGSRSILPRLTPLPSRGTPVVVYLGLMRDGKTAVFLVSSDVHAEGDTTCRPSASNCQIVRLKAGETEFFDVTGGGQYQLDVIKVARRTVASASAARRVSGRVSSRGRRIVRTAQAFSAHTAVASVLRYDAGSDRLVAPLHP